MAKKHTTSPERTRLHRAVAGRPRLFIGAAIAITVLVLLSVLPPDRLWTTRLLLAWDAGVGFFLISVIPVIAGAETADIRWRAERQDVAPIFFLAATATAAVASLGAIYAEVSTVAMGSPAAGWRLLLAGATVILSWLFVHVFFAFHYAHEFYGQGTGKPGGLRFPGGLEEPDYLDFLYFSLVIGMTSQVSDVAVTSRSVRRTVAAHGVLAFFFNVALLALVVNIAGDAIRRGFGAPN